MSPSASPTPTPTPTPGVGRTLRAIVGFVIILVDIAVFFYDHVILKDSSFEVLEIAGHVVVLFVGLLLIDPKIAGEFFDKAGKMMPWTKK